VSLQGAIEEMGLCELLQALALNRYKGTLRIETDSGLSRFFYLNEGEIVLFRAVQTEPVRIGELLVRSGKITQEQLDGSLAKQGARSAKRVGDLLIQQGFVTRVDIDQVLRRRFEEEFLDIFLLDRGHFEFIFGLSPDALFAPDQKLERIALQTASLMLEAMRRVDDWHAMLKDLGSLDELYMRRKPTVRVSPQDTVVETALSLTLRDKVLESVDGKRSLREIVAMAQEAGASRLAALSYLHALKNLGVVAPLDVDTCLHALADALGAQDVDATSKLIRSVLAKGLLELSLVEQYIDFLRQSGRPSLARSECKLLAAHFLHLNETDHAIALYERALELDKRDTEVLDRLFYAHLRKSDVERALDVGSLLRESLGRDRDLPIVGRILKNMKELAPDDTRVLELAGLFAKKEERRDEARVELGKALVAAQRTGGKGQTTRIASIRAALADLDPTFKSSSTNRVLAVAPMGVARRRRGAAPVVVAVALVALGARLVLDEVRARAELASGREEERSDEVAARLRALGSYRAAASRLATVRGEARTRAADLEARLAAAIKAPEPAPVVAPPPPPPPAEASASTRSNLARLEDARQAKNWALVAKLTLALADATRDPRGVPLGGGRFAPLLMPVNLTSFPPGARVAVADAEETSGVTPCVLELPLGKTVRLRATRRGFAPLETTVVADGLKDVSLPLNPGACWRRELGGLAAGLAVSPGAAGGTIVVVLRSGDVRAFGADGSPRWQHAVETPAPDDHAPPEELSAPAIVQGTVVVSARSGLLLGYDLATGAPRFRLTGKGSLFAPVSVEVDLQAYALVVRGETLDLVDTATAKVVRSIELDSRCLAPPVVRSGRAYVLLQDGSIASVDLAQGTVAWTTDPKVSAAGGAALAKGPGLLLLASRDGSLLGFSFQTGALVWKRTSGVGLVETGLSVDETRAFLSSSSGRTAVFDAKDGKLLWEQPGPGPPSGPPVRLYASVYLTPRTGGLAELDLNDGKARSVLPFDGIASGPPIVCGPDLVLLAGTSIFAYDRGE
jgi:outer membrane protein assembly factor BamB/tetratricopeptide (TPR) repeat protein